MTQNRTVGGDNSDVTSLGRHVSDGEPRVVTQVVTLDATERIARRPSSANAEQHTYDETVIMFLHFLSDHCGHSEVHCSTYKNTEIVTLMLIINTVKIDHYKNF